MNDSERAKFLIEYLLNENGGYADMRIPTDEENRFRMFRSLVNVRPARPVSENFLKVQDEYLRSLIEKAGVTDIAQLEPVEKGIYLWQGDITTLRCDAIVNAANSAMTGCYIPCHACIDNCIHTFAGVQLRLECERLMNKQGHPEETGKAKITSAYALPCRYVIHTVGPVVNGVLTDEHRRLLKSCYDSCLEIAEQNGVKSIAFCCISTGVFGFPKKEAAETAVAAVREYVKNHDIKVIFNVFSKTDNDIYLKALSQTTA